MMTVINIDNLEKEKRILKALKELIKNDTNDKDRQYHMMAIKSTKAHIKKLKEQL